jgi:DNA-directed RNA polymerase specialized sigma24 family protein
MSRNFDEILPDEAQKQRSRFAPVEVPAPARPVWNWEELNAKFRPRLIAAGVIRFGLTQDDCEDAAQTVFLKVLAMNPRVRDPKAYLRAAFLNQCSNLIEARERRRGHESELTDQFAATLAETAERSGYSSKTVWKRIQERLKRMRACLS